MTLHVRRALAGTAVAAIALALVASRLPSAEAWTRLTPGDCAQYCEASQRCGALATRSAIQQPLNSWSNLAYLFVGLVALGPSVTPLGAVFALSCALLALGSFGFHATVTRELQWLDVVGMLVALFALAARAAHAAWRVEVWRALAGWALASALFARFKWQIPTTPLMVATALLVAAATTALVRRRRIRLRFGVLALALVAVGYGVRELDVRHVGCDPTSLLYQGHAVWHLLTAGSLLAAWRAFDDVAPPSAAAP